MTYDLVLLAPDSQSLESALPVLDQVARRCGIWTVGVVVTPSTAAVQGDQAATAVATTAPPPGWRFQVPGQHHPKEWGGQDQENQSRISAASQGLQVPQKVGVHFQAQPSNHKGLEL